MVSHELSKPRRIELILRQIDSLPTLPAVATKLLSITADDDSSAKQVTQLIQSDPSLTAKVLSLCRTAEKGVRSDVLTIDRAVVLLGFNAIRNAVLSVKVIEVFGGTVDGDLDQPAAGVRFAEQDPQGKPLAGLDRHGYWAHCLAVAIAAEKIARAHRDAELPADEAFVCGLLHDIGKLALDHVLPRSYRRVVELADLNRGDIAEYERKVLGLDHHTAGKRLAEQWKLPLLLQDCIWLHGSPFETLPAIEHRRMVGLVKLADMVVRGRHVGFSGNHSHTHALDALATQIELNPEKVRHATADLFEQLEVRGQALGIHDEPSQELALRSIQQANEALGRANAVLERRSANAAVQKRLAETITAFNQSVTPGRSVQDALDAVAFSAGQYMGEGFYALLYPTREATIDDHGEPGVEGYWLISQYNRQGEPVDAHYVDRPRSAPDIARMDPAQSIGMEMMGVMPWIADYLVAADDLRDVKLLPLPCGWGTVALLLFSNERTAHGGGGPSWNLIEPLAGCWGNAIAAAAQHEGARRLGEQLAEANSALAAAQDRLLRAESLARLGEMASGAAHEMNNPLAVISGRSQLLTMTLPQGSDNQKSAQMIFRESHRLSDLITCLRMFADPPIADRKPADVFGLLDSVVKKVRNATKKQNGRFEVDLQLPRPIPAVDLDADQIARAVTELLFNAVQAQPKGVIVVVAKLLDEDNMLMIQVIDDGEGMDDYTLSHALDPFFSAKPAGRQVGMGLPRAQQLAAAHGGLVQLRSDPGRGTVATLSIPLDSPARTPDVGGGEPPEASGSAQGDA